MENKYCVYRITNKLNGMVYIGQSKNLKARWSSKGIHYSSCPRFYNAIVKYGWDNFEREILKDNLSHEEANILEIQEIRNHKSREREFGYNIALGGNGGIIYLEHPKGMLGKSQTDYQKESHRLWALDNENNCMTNGKVVWGETHEHPKGMKGKKQSGHQKEIARKGKYAQKRVEAILPNGEVKNFDSLNDCCDFFDILPTSAVTLRLLKTNEPYILSKNINKKTKAKLEKIVGLILRYKDNSEV